MTLFTDLDSTGSLSRLQITDSFSPPTNRYVRSFNQKRARLLGHETTRPKTFRTTSTPLVRGMKTPDLVIFTLSSRLSNMWPPPKISATSVLYLKPFLFYILQQNCKYDVCSYVHIRGFTGRYALQIRKDLLYIPRH